MGNDNYSHTSSPLTLSSYSSSLSWNTCNYLQPNNASVEIKIYIRCFQWQGKQLSWRWVQHDIADVCGFQNIGAKVRYCLLRWSTDFSWIIPVCTHSNPSEKFHQRTLRYLSSSSSSGLGMYSQTNDELGLFFVLAICMYSQICYTATCEGRQNHQCVAFNIVLATSGVGRLSVTAHDLYYQEIQQCTTGIMNIAGYDMLLFPCCSPVHWHHCFQIFNAVCGWMQH